MMQPVPWMVLTHDLKLNTSDFLVTSNHVSIKKKPELIEKEDGSRITVGAWREGKEYNFPSRTDTERNMRISFTQKEMITLSEGSVIYRPSGVIFWAPRNNVPECVLSWRETGIMESPCKKKKYTFRNPPCPSLTYKDGKIEKHDSIKKAVRFIYEGVPAGSHFAEVSKKGYIKIGDAWAWTSKKPIPEDVLRLMEEV